MAAKKAYKGEITLAFDYKSSTNSKRYEIKTENISYVILEHLYENTHILPVIYINLNVDSNMASKIKDSYENSTFYLKILKKNGLSKSSMTTEVVNDVFSYVSSSTNPNYAENMNSYAPEGSSNSNITVGLVSAKLTNILRKSFNNVYSNTNTEKLIKMATAEMPNLIMEPIKYNTEYKSILIPPIKSIYKFLFYLFNKDPFYDSIFTLYMDFKKSYLISKHGVAIPGGDAQPTNVNITIKDFDQKDAYNEGFTKSNGAYNIFVNASDTNVVLNNATEKETSNIVAYSDDISTQNLNPDIISSNSITEKKSYMRTSNAAAVKNEMQTNSCIVSLMKQNLDPDIFTPNKVFNVTHHSSYSKYNGPYILSSKKECYYQTANKEFIMTCNVNLKKVASEEKAKAIKDTAKKSSGRYSRRSSSAGNGSSTKATR